MSRETRFSFHKSSWLAWIQGAILDLLGSAQSWGPQRCKHKASLTPVVAGKQMERNPSHIGTQTPLSVPISPGSGSLSLQGPKYVTRRTQDSVCSEFPGLQSLRKDHTQHTGQLPTSCGFPEEVGMVPSLNTDTSASTPGSNLN
jgi:hypothetical protein